MYLYHYGKVVHCDHMKEDGFVARKSTIEVDDRIIAMFGNARICGAYIYDEIKRIYGKEL